MALKQNNLVVLYKIFVIKLLQWTIKNIKISDSDH